MQDVNDILIMEYLLDRNPFASNVDLRTISSGVIAFESNVDYAKQIGVNSIDKLTGRDEF